MRKMSDRWEAGPERVKLDREDLVEVGKQEARNLDTGNLDIGIPHWKPFTLEIWTLGLDAGAWTWTMGGCPPMSWSRKGKV